MSRKTKKTGTENVQNSVDKSAKIYQRSKISFELNLAKPEWTPKQKELIEIIRDSNTKYVFIKGASGTSKTFISLAVGLELLNSGRIKEIVLIRSICESGEISLGSLPGHANEDEKLAPFMAPFLDKLNSLLTPQDIKKLQDDKRLIYLPINYLRGREFNASYIIIDELQNFNKHEIQTAMTRLGRYSKMILAGDNSQVDYIKGRKIESGFDIFYNWYNKEDAKERGVHCFKFGVEDIFRDEIIKYIVTEYDQLKLMK